MSNQNNQAVQQCVNSKGANDYIQGIQGFIGENIPEKRKNELKRHWCSGYIGEFEGGQ